jgi:hypothetical protein
MRRARRDLSWLLFFFLTGCAPARHEWSAPPDTVMHAQPASTLDSTDGRRRDSLIAVARRARRPRFEDYPVESTACGPAASPRLVTPEARRYRTAIRQGTARGANFARCLTVVTWGCGTECQQLAVVDRRTGAVWVSPWIAAALVSHRLDSGLLIVNPPENTREAVRMGADPGRYFARYYRWTGATLALIDSLPPTP